MKVLVFGANGMLGHIACRVLGESFDVHGTARRALSPDELALAGLTEERLIVGYEAGAANPDDTLRAVRPDVVMNCVGVVKQKKEAEDAVTSIRINALFPHELAGACDGIGAKLIHVSTDCVFSGRRGGSDEESAPDPPDLYGRTKLIGEVVREPHLTLRTSIIGRQLEGTTGMLEWFLSQRGGAVDGFVNARFSGLTTVALARVIQELLRREPDLTGLFHVASEPIDKYTLLRAINERFDLGVRVRRSEEFYCDRHLDGRQFETRTGISVPSWEAMLDELADWGRFNDYK